MKIAFFTPLNPLKSGVSDFCEELLLELGEHVDIDIFIGDYKPTNKDIINRFRIRSITEFEQEEVRNKYDEVIYQIGNNEVCHKDIYNMALKYPGIIELHDISLHHMIAATTIAKGDVGEYKRIMKYCHGEGALKVVDQFLNSEIEPPWENNSLTFTMNKEIIDSAKSVIVHSDYAKQMVKGVRNDVNVTTIYLHADEICVDYKREKLEARKRHHINKDEIVFATFGFITRPKRITEILKTLKEIKKNGYSFKFYIVGKVDDNLNIGKVIKQYDLTKEVVVTGFVEMNVMKDLMKASDICFCLRYPTQGESSAIVHRLLGMGKVIFVTNIGTFAEYPDDVVIKINQDKEMEDMFNNIKDMLIQSQREIYEKKSLQFGTENCFLEGNVKFYVYAIVGNSKSYEFDIGNLIVDAMMNLEIYDEEVIRKIGL